MENNMDLDLAIKERRSIRVYDNVPVSKEKLYEIIQAGVWAPSACNLQLWKFIIIDQPEILKKICELGGASFIKNVNQAIVVLYNNQTDNIEYSDYIQSGSAAIQNMLLKAHSLNIGTCWVNNLPNKKVLRKLLDIPEYYDPIAMITLGYYSQKINARDRKYDLNTQIAYNKFTFSDIDKKPWMKVKLRRCARKIYKKMPCKKVLNKFVGKLEKKFDN